MKACHRIVDVIENGFAVIAGLLLVLTLLLVPVDVSGRFLFNRPLAWVYEVTEYILLFIPCFGMAWLARIDGHVAIDIITSRLSRETNRKLSCFVYAVVALVCWFVTYWGTQVTAKSCRAGAIIENVLQTPQWLVYIAIPIGFFLCGVEFARKALANLSDIDAGDAAATNAI
jgi:C4-dicarboxylate transporter, DctQ subunit